MARTYYTLAIRENGKWAPQFGDYSRNCVMEEIENIMDGFNSPSKKDIKIVTSGDTQSAINAAIAKLNS